MSWFLSFLPRTWLQFALKEQWARSLPRGEQQQFLAGFQGRPGHDTSAYRAGKAAASELNGVKA